MRILTQVRIYHKLLKQLKYKENYINSMDKIPF